MEIVDLKEAQELFDEEKMRQEMLDKLTVVFCAINEKIRAKNVTYHWTDKKFDVSLRAVILNDDDIVFVCKEYEQTGGFPYVIGTANTVLRTAAFTFFLEDPRVEATDDGETETDKTIV